jgi:hypothetical protein
MLMHERPASGVARNATTGNDFSLPRSSTTGALRERIEKSRTMKIHHGTV